MDSEEPVSIKTEIDLITVEESSISIKIENETELETTDGQDKTQECNTMSPLQDIEVNIKDENVLDNDNSLLLERRSEITETLPMPVITPHILPNDINIQNSMYPGSMLQSELPIGVKEEQTDESLVSYDYPNFDTVSMDSNEATALGNVEACLHDDVNVKYEAEQDDDHQKEDINDTVIKTDPDLTITDTHLTSTNHSLDIASSSDTKYSFIMKIPNNVVNNLDEVTNGSYEDNLYEDDDPYDVSELCETKHVIEGTTPQENQYKFNNGNFQLNSITGDYLSLEQEAYLIKAKQEIEKGNLKIYSCPKCIKKYLKKAYLAKHLQVHQTIENYANGRIRGQKTRKKNMIKKLRMLKKLAKKLEKEAQNPTQPKPEQKEGYKCTCGSVFKRRSRMETCLRSHNLFENDSKFVTCTTCTKKFKTKEELWYHRKRLHRKKFPCKFCPTDYETRKQLFKHLQLHQKVQLMEYKVIEEYVNGKKELHCFMCATTFTELSELKVHVMMEHKSPYSCPHCKNNFPSIMEFGDHTKTYHPEVEGQSVLDVLEAFSKLVKEWKCIECGTQFLEADKLALHQIEEHSSQSIADPQFQCSDCRRVFVSQKGLTSHRRIHHSIETSDEPPKEIGIMCLECRKICKDMNALTSHMRLHSPNRKYPCKFCDYRFATPEKRKAHSEIHTGDMKFVCFICEYQCSSENRLKQHKMSIKHINMREYLLTGKPLIEESSSSEKGKEKKNCSARKRKKTEENGEEQDSEPSSSEVACDVCGEKFSNEQKMLDHKQIHPFIEFPNEDTPTRIFFK